MSSCRCRRAAHYARRAEARSKITDLWVDCIDSLATVSQLVGLTALFPKVTAVRFEFLPRVSHKNSVYSTVHPLVCMYVA